MMPKQGDQAPDFSLRDSEGSLHKLSDYKGRKIILYFYPKDDTPGCTKEACNFRDSHKAIQKKNAVVIGISADSEQSHRKFIGKYGLPFVLLSDPEKNVISQYGALKKAFGKTFLGISRSTFLIDEKGKIMKVFPNVDIDSHAAEIMKILGQDKGQ